MPLQHQQEEEIALRALSLPAQDEASVPAEIGSIVVSETMLTSSETTRCAIDDLDDVLGPLHRLQRNNPVRRLALQALTGTESKTIQPLLNALANSSGRKWRERQVAAWTLGQLPLTTEQRNEASALLLRVLDNALPSDGLNAVLRGVGWAMSASCVLSLVAALPTGYILQGLMDFFEQAISMPVFSFAHTFSELFKVLFLITTFPTLATVLPTSLAAERVRLNRVRAAAANSLGELESIQAVAALAAGTKERSAPVRRACLPALRRVLTHLTPDHYAQLPAATVPNLCRLLDHADSLLVRDILNALEKIGDGRAILSVSRLVAKGATPDIRETAVRILPILQMRQKQDNSPSVLLRAAAPDNAQPDVLLRAATATATPKDSEPDHLLRAVVHAHVAAPTQSQEVGT